jgi:hypothetical protein
VRGEPFADHRGPSVLPADRGGEGGAGPRLPGQHGLALVGEPHRLGVLPRLGEGPPGGLQDRGPELLGVLFHAAVRGGVGVDGDLGLRQDAELA